jgi:4-diphosphocytidyl-2-C-methyl-D-erythritol kinase
VSRLILSAPAKINLHLQVLGPRGDGHHELWTLFQTIDLADELVVEDDPGGAVVLEVAPQGGAPSGSENLVVKAVSALRERAGVERGAVLRLRKRIPIGAGLGGGSADAAAALVAVDRLWNTRLSNEELADLAAGVGSDVGFFLHGGLALGRGRGDTIDCLPDLQSFSVVVVLPGFEVSTAWAFAAIDLRLTSRRPDATVDAFVAGCLENRGEDPPWSGLFNDFEEVVTEQRPEIGRVLRAVRATGPLHAALTGSGAAVFGVFADPAAARRAAHEIGSEWQVHVGSTLGRRQARLLD